MNTCREYFRQLTQSLQSFEYPTLIWQQDDMWWVAYDLPHTVPGAFGPTRRDVILLPLWTPREGLESPHLFYTAQPRWVMDALERIRQHIVCLTTPKPGVIFRSLRPISWKSVPHTGGKR